MNMTVSGLDGKSGGSMKCFGDIYISIGYSNGNCARRPTSSANNCFF